MRLFELVRTTDVSGVSGTGVVAEGVIFGDESVAIRWRGEHASTVVWRNLSDAMHVHGHGGQTQLRWRS